MILINILCYTLIAIALCFDIIPRFTKYKTNYNYQPNQLIIAVVLVGVFNFLFSLVLFYLTHLVINIPSSIGLNTYGNIVGGLLIIIIGLSIFKKENTNTTTTPVSLISILMLAFAISSRSLFIGIAFSLIPTYNIIVYSLIITILSSGIGLLAFFANENFVNKTKKVNLQLISGLLVIIYGILIIFKVI